MKWGGYNSNGCSWIASVLGRRCSYRWLAAIGLWIAVAQILAASAKWHP